MRVPTRRSASFLPLTAAALSLVASMLACSRADVPSPSGSGSLPVAVAPTAANSGAPTETSAPPATEMPTPTILAPAALVSPTFPPTVAAEPADAGDTVLYETQAGDTPRAIAVRFGVLPSDLTSAGGPLPADGSLIDSGTRLIIPRRLTLHRTLPATDPRQRDGVLAQRRRFRREQLPRNLGGYLTRYQEYIAGEMRPGPEVLALAARDNSVNPRLLLALLEYQSGWVTNPTRPSGDQWKYPMGRIDPGEAGLYRQLTWAANELGNGYYGWRAGTLTEIRLRDGIRLRLAPELNAGTIALQWYFGLHDNTQKWAVDIGPDGLMGTYQKLFGDPEDYFHPLYEPGLEQPEMILPFLPGHIWSFTGGPHGAWEREAAWAALDFAPSTIIPGCDRVGRLGRRCRSRARAAQ